METAYPEYDQKEGMIENQDTCGNKKAFKGVEYLKTGIRIVICQKISNINMTLNTFSFKNQFFLNQISFA